MELSPPSPFNGRMLLAHAFACEADLFAAAKCTSAHLFPIQPFFVVRCISKLSDFILVWWVAHIRPEQSIDLDVFLISPSIYVYLLAFISYCFSKQLPLECESSTCGDSMMTVLLTLSKKRKKVAGTLWRTWITFEWSLLATTPIPVFVMFWWRK